MLLSPLMHLSTVFLCNKLGYDDMMTCARRAVPLARADPPRCQLAVVVLPLAALAVEVGPTQAGIARLGPDAETAVLAQVHVAVLQSRLTQMSRKPCRPKVGDQMARSRTSNVRDPLCSVWS